MSENYLIHHGILGQKWGHMQGPPYPLGSGDHSSSEKAAAKSAGIKVGKSSGKESIKSAKGTYKIALKEYKNSEKRYINSMDKVLGIFRDGATADKNLEKKYNEKLSKYNDALENYELAKSTQKGKYTKKYIEIQKEKKYHEVYNNSKSNNADTIHNQAKKASEAYAEQLRNASNINNNVKKSYKETENGSTKTNAKVDKIGEIDKKYANASNKKWQRKVNKAFKDYEKSADRDESKALRNGDLDAARSIAAGRTYMRTLVDSNYRVSAILLGDKIARGQKYVTSITRNNKLGGIDLVYNDKTTFNLTDSKQLPLKGSKEEKKIIDRGDKKK